MSIHGAKLAFPLVIGGVFLCSGTRVTRDATIVTEAKEATTQKVSTVAYSYDGKGDRPKFVKNPALLIDTIKVGPWTSRIRGMTTKGQCAAIDTYSPAEIKFAEGTTKTFTSVTLEGWSGYPPALVTVR